jgi:hypothetical protein
VTRQPLVDERVVGVHQVEHAAVLAHDALEKELGLALEGLSKVVVEIGEQLGVRHLAFEVAQMQPLSREIAHEG